VFILLSPLSESYGVALQEKVDEMLKNLTDRAEKRIILSFAPSTPYYEVLKRIGELFPKGAKVNSSLSALPSAMIVKVTESTWFANLHAMRA
jgi:hypothetical protein